MNTLVAFLPLLVLLQAQPETSCSRPDSSKTPSIYATTTGQSTMATNYLRSQIVRNVDNALRKNLNQAFTDLSEDCPKSSTESVVENTGIIPQTNMRITCSGKDVPPRAKQQYVSIQQSESSLTKGAVIPLTLDLVSRARPCNFVPTPINPHALVKEATSISLNTNTNTVPTTPRQYGSLQSASLDSQINSLPASGVNVPEVILTSTNIPISLGVAPIQPKPALSQVMSTPLVVQTVLPSSITPQNAPVGTPMPAYFCGKSMYSLPPAPTLQSQSGSGSQQPTSYNQNVLNPNISAQTLDTPPQISIDNIWNQNIPSEALTGTQQASSNSLQVPPTQQVATDQTKLLSPPSVLTYPNIQSDNVTSSGQLPLQPVFVTLNVPLLPIITPLSTPVLSLDSSMSPTINTLSLPQKSTTQNTNCQSNPLNNGIQTRPFSVSPTQYKPLINLDQTNQPSRFSTQQSPVCS